MPQPERLRAIQQAAATQRASAPGLDAPLWTLPAAGDTGATRAHAGVLGCLEARGLDVFRLPPGDPLLGGARAVFDREFVAYDAGLPGPAATFSLAHELGHTLLHGGHGGCAPADIDDECDTTLQTAPGGVEVYSPRQQREQEANAFAAAFLMPAAELRAAFLAGLDYNALAARYGVSESAMLNTLAAALLTPQAPAPAGPPPEAADPAPPVAPLSPPPGPAAIRLDPSQEAAATVAHGPVLIDAGPGTGKTRTLIERVLFLLRRGTPATAILALTFSNRAAAEMRERLRVAGPDAEAITVGTFHAFCLQFLQEHAAEAGLPLGPRLIDGVQATAWLETRLPELRLRRYGSLFDPGRSLPAILGAISRARDELCDAAGYARLAEQAAAEADPADAEAQERAQGWREVAQVYAVYEEILEAKGAIDFGGLLLRTVETLRARPALLKAQQARYREILVDEYQDMNRASAVLLQLLAGDARGLWVVGDLRQAIYRFRGASPANINEFESDFPGGRRLRLAVNYRSDPAIVGLFAAFGRAMPLAGAEAIAWEAQRAAQPGPRVWQGEAEDGAAEAQGIVAEVARRHAAGRAYREQAILCRTHGQAAGVARALEDAGLPALYLGSLFEREEVRDLLALLSLAAEGNGWGLLRATRLTGRPVDRAECAALISYAREQEIPFPRALALAAEAGLSAEAVAACAELAAAIEAAGAYRAAAPFLARYLFGAAGPLRAALGQPSARNTSRVLALSGLMALARGFDELERPMSTGGAAPLRDFLAHVRRLYAAKEGPSRTPAGADDLDAVRVMTVHASKGLEFPVVYVPSLASGRFPAREQPETCPPPPGLIRGADPGDAQREEMCLFFVALSRARDELVLSRAARYGKPTAKPSPFWAHLEAALQEQGAPRLQWAGSAAEAPEAPAPPPTPDRVVDIEDVELFLRCPRRYEYDVALRLGEGADGEGYLRFHRVVTGVVRQMRADRPAGALPADEGAALARLAAAWEGGGPQGHVYEPIWAEAARGLVVSAWQRMQAAPPDAPAWREELHLPLGGATVRMRVDGATRDADGSVRVVRRRLGRARDEDRRAPRLALLRAAARQESGAEVRVDLEYMDTGDTVEVEAKERYDRPRVDKLAAAVEGIRAGAFPPAPAEADECLRCPFWMICPA